MIYLKAANLEDAKKEYEFISQTPVEENGFMNCHSGCTYEEFVEKVLPHILDNAKGVNLSPGHVPQTEFFLWEDEQIIGLFKIRHYLNDALANGAGHIGYGIRKEYRGKGYATKGLELAVEMAWTMIQEDEIYMSVNKDNLASLKVQLKNGAYIHREDDKEYYTRIKKAK